MTKIKSLHTMTIITITKKGSIKLPREATLHLGKTQHLQVRLNSTGITLTPVQVQSVSSLKAIPQIPANPLQQ